MTAGRRSGKTEIAKRKLVISLTAKRPWKDPRHFAAAPTRGQAKRIYWHDLKTLVPPRWVRRVYETDLCIVTRHGGELWVVGLDRPQRIEGTPWDGGVLDEYADMRPAAWAENIRPALSDRGGWCWFIGVPQGANHFKDLAEYARTAGDPDWGCYSWPSSDVLPATEVEAARRVLDDRTFRQEYEASFECRTGLVYYAYDPAAHEDDAITIAEDLPIAVCCDFNVDPCVWEVAQSDGRSVRIVDEIVMKDANTMEMAREFLRRYRRHRAGIRVYGDAAGAARSTTGKTDYAILAGMGLTDQRIRRKNPQVKDRVNAVNAMLRTASGEARLFHHPVCVELRKDLERVTWAKDTGELDKRDRERTHATDAIGYFIEYEFPIRPLMPVGERRFYK